MITENISDFMRRDHKRLDGISKKFDSISAFAEFKIGLERHIVWEEEILFPAFEEKTGIKEAGPTEAMRSEHRQIRDYLEKIHNNISDSEAKKCLTEILTEHNQKEENVLYPWLEKSLTAEEAEEIFQKMENLPAEKHNRCCG